MKPKQNFSPNFSQNFSPNFSNEMFNPNEFMKFFENYQSPAFDMKSFLETQRKNMQAVSQAQQLALQACQMVSQRQSAFISQMVEDNSSLAREIMSEGTPEEKIAKNAEIFKEVYERTVKNMKELSEMVSKCGQDASNVINKRVTATMNEIQDAVEKSQTKKAA